MGQQNAKRAVAQHFIFALLVNALEVGLEEGIEGPGNGLNIGHVFACGLRLERSSGWPAVVC
jgi:hypothetical protein